MRYNELLLEFNKPTRLQYGRYLAVYRPTQSGKYQGVIYIDTSTGKPDFKNPKKVLDLTANDERDMKVQIQNYLHQQQQMQQTQNPTYVNINFNVDFTNEYLTDTTPKYIRFLDLDGASYLEFAKEGKPDGEGWIRINDSQKPMTANSVPIMQGKMTGKTLDRYKLSANWRYVLEYDRELSNQDPSHYVFRIVPHSKTLHSHDNVRLGVPAITFAAYNE